MSTLNRFNSGWGLVPDGTKLQRYNNGWGVASKAQVYNSGWGTIWNKSDPVTYQYYPWFCDNIRHGTSNAWTTNTSNEPHIGGFNGTYPYPYVGVISIGSPVNSSHPQASAALSTRPVISDIKLRLTRASGVGLNASVVSGTMHIGTLTIAYNGSNWNNDTMATLDNYFDFTPATTKSLSNWDYDQTQTFDIDPQQGYDMIDSNYALIIASQTSGFTSTDTFSGYSASLDYMKFYDHLNSTAAYRPMFEITFDYV